MKFRYLKIVVFTLVIFTIFGLNLKNSNAFVGGNCGGGASANNLTGYLTWSVGGSYIHPAWITVDWGDGSGVVDFTGDGGTVSHDYAGPGTFTVSYNADSQDGIGLCGKDYSITTTTVNPINYCNISSFTADNLNPACGTGTTLRYFLDMVGSYTWNISSSVAPSPSSGTSPSGTAATGNLTSAKTYHLTCGGATPVDVTVTPGSCSAALQYRCSGTGSCIYVGNDGTGDTADSNCNYSCSAPTCQDSSANNYRGALPCTYTSPQPTCYENASVVVTQALPATMIVGRTYPFSMRVTNTGDTRWYHGSIFHFNKVSGNLAITPSSGFVGGFYPTWSDVWTFDVTPTVVGAASVGMQMVHSAWSGNNTFLKPDGTECPAPDSDYYFGNVGTVSSVVANAPIDGGWCGFTGWSACSVSTCGLTGAQTRTNSCTCPAPQYGGAACSSPGAYSQSCSTADCPTGWISASDCIIPQNGSSCNSTVSWGTTSPWGTSAVTTPTGNTVANVNSSAGTSYAIPNPDATRTFYLYNNSSLLGQATATAVCALGTGWYGGVCRAPINCAGNWLACSAGSQTYSITTAAAYGGAACPFANGATQTGCGHAASWSGYNACSGGDQTGTCTEATGGGSPTCVGLGYSVGVNHHACGTPASVNSWSACVNGTRFLTCTEATGGGSPTCAGLVPSRVVGMNTQDCGTSGICSSPPTHYSCTRGTSANNVNNPTTWTWNCNSTDGGINASCSQSKAMSGTLTVPTCPIALNASSCSSNASWSITDTEGTPTAITANGMTDINVTNTLVTPQSGTQAVTIPYPNRTFYLYNNGKSLVPTSPSGSGVLATPHCTSGTGWDSVSGTCKTIINGGWTTFGACSVTANCAVGTQTRTCTLPTPQYGGADCVGLASQSCSATCTNVSGTLTANPTSCLITLGNNSCNVNLTWTTTYPEATSAITANGMTNVDGNSGVNVPFAVPGLSRTFYLYNNAKSLVPGGVLVTSSCSSGTYWNGLICAGGSVVPGGWTPWSTCSAVTCGTQGTQTRSCTNPTPMNGGANCNLLDGDGSLTSKNCTAPVSVTVTVNPATIKVGESTNLTWFSCASTCAGTNFDTGGAPSGGPLVMHPTATTVYTATCNNYHF